MITITEGDSNFSFHMLQMKILTGDSGPEEHAVNNQSCQLLDSRLSEPTYHKLNCKLLFSFEATLPLKKKNAHNHLDSLLSY